MPLEAPEHYTVHCTDLEGTRDFYRDVLGLKEGYRPNFAFAVFNAVLALATARSGRV